MPTVKIYAPGHEKVDCERVYPIPSDDVASRVHNLSFKTVGIKLQPSQTLALIGEMARAARSCAPEEAIYITANRHTRKVDVCIVRYETHAEEDAEAEIGA